MGLGLTTGLTSLIRHQFITKSLKVPGKTGHGHVYQDTGQADRLPLWESSPRLKNVPLMADGG
ncbi:MAG: hypothetical protein R2857_08090 [Vampirovibrionales bacterium]